MIGFANFVVVDIDAQIPLDERRAYAKAQQHQIHYDFAPRWGRIAGVRVATPDNLPKPGEIEVRLLDKPTADGALGYHDCKPDGTPIAYVFVGLAKSFGMRWESVASHEVLEILGDPLLRRAVEMRDGFWDSEVCDRVEQDSYMVMGVPLSNFNTPEAFEPPQDLSGVKFDIMGKSTYPNEIRPGGYAQKFDPSKGWTQIQNGEMSPYRMAMSSYGISRGRRRREQFPKAKVSWLKKLLARVFGPRALRA
jgi:hypothetical protein